MKQMTGNFARLGEMKDNQDNDLEARNFQNLRLK
jgi:hypothetical protein